jgi:cytochrome c5
MCVFHSPFVVALAALGATAMLGACGKNGGAGVPTSGPAQSGGLPPDLEAIYERSCKNCHSMPASGAPQTGDARAWAPRITQCADSLLVHTFNGYKSMPPMGACMDCDEEQYRALIEYMSGAKLEWRCSGRAHSNPTAS